MKQKKEWERDGETVVDFEKYFLSKSREKKQFTQNKNEGRNSKIYDSNNQNSESSVEIVWKQTNKWSELWCLLPHTTTHAWGGAYDCTHLTLLSDFHLMHVCCMATCVSVSVWCARALWALFRVVTFCWFGYCCVLLPAAAVDATSSCWCSLLLCLRARSSVCVRVCLCIFCLVSAVNRRHVTFQQQFLFRPIHVQQQQQQLTLLHWLYMCKCKCACLFCSHNTKKRSFNSSRSSSIYTHSRHTIETDFGCLFYRRALLLYCISVSSDKPTYSDRFSFEAARFFSISEILKEKIEQE